MMESDKHPAPVCASVTTQIRISGPIKTNPRIGTRNTRMPWIKTNEIRMRYIKMHYIKMPG
jgi:hypothetical protein